MTDLLPDQTVDGWNSCAEGFDRNVWDLMDLYAAEIVERAELGPDCDVLDIAAGSGPVAMRAAPKVRSLTAVDFAERMLERLQRRAEQAGLDNVRTACMDAQSLELEDASFDRACSNFGLIFCPDRAKALAETSRVLRPGGRALLTAWSTPDRFEGFNSLMGAVRTAVPDLPAPTSPPPLFSLSDPDQLVRELREAGFDDVHVDTVTHVQQADEAEALWTILSTAPPALALLARIGPDAAEGVRSAFFSQMRERFGDGPIRLSNEAHVAVAHKRA